MSDCSERDYALPEVRDTDIVSCGVLTRPRSELFCLGVGETVGVWPDLRHSGALAGRCAAANNEQ